MVPQDFTSIIVKQTTKEYQDRIAMMAKYGHWSAIQTQCVIELTSKELAEYFA